MIDFDKQLIATEQNLDVLCFAIEDAGDIALGSHSRTGIHCTREQVKRLQATLAHWQDQAEELLDSVEARGTEFGAWADEEELTAGAAA
tara:strand:+ start:492 stop:758 length:267 start_codon:yes stop_codon:yes gene_type:complete